VCFEKGCGAFVAAPDVVDWIRDTFISGIARSPLANPDHGHLALATLGVLWTNEQNSSKGRAVVGMAEIFAPKGNAWQNARQEQQLREFFGGILPDFILTLSAPYAIAIDDATFCALVEHELYHCAQALDQYGSPKFDRDGVPGWTIRGHDVEQFVGVVRRYGARAAGVDLLVVAAKLAESQPIVRATEIAGACGTCLARVA
jgi:Putative phage metallopeptidase